jgi:hypothetical protein
METLVGILAFGKLGFIAIFAYVSARAAEKLYKSDTPKSSLSRDGIAERMRKTARERVQADARVQQ